MFKLRLCAAGCGQTAISGSELCGEHVLDPPAEALRIAGYIRENAVIRDICGGRLRYVDVDFSDKQFYGCDFFHSFFINCNFKNAIVRTSVFDFSAFIDCDCRDMKLDFVTMAGTKLRNTSFKGSDMRQLNFCGASIHNCDLSETDLYNSRFIMANIRGTNISDSNLKKVSFVAAEIEDVNFKFSSTNEAVFENEG
jgi:uncharacterized protein YjbI with pentapeptide repeats